MRFSPSLLAWSVALSMGLASPSLGSPLAGAGALSNDTSESLVQDARVFCYNTYSGRFLHWGGCGYRVVYRPYRPRVYCRSNFSGQFLHWGRC